MSPNDILDLAFCAFNGLKDKYAIPKINIDYNEDESVTLNLTGVFEEKAKYDQYLIPYKTLNNGHTLVERNFPIKDVCIYFDGRISFDLVWKGSAKLIKIKYKIIDLANDTVVLDAYDFKFFDRSNGIDTIYFYSLSEEVYKKINTSAISAISIEARVCSTKISLYSKAKNIVNWFENPYSDAVANLGFFNKVEKADIETEWSNVNIDMDQPIDVLPLYSIVTFPTLELRRNVFVYFADDYYTITDENDEEHSFRIVAEPRLKFIGDKIYASYVIHFSLPGILKEKAAEIFFNKLKQPFPVSVVYEDHTVDTTGRLVYDKESNWYMIQIYPVELTSRVVKILLQIYR